MSDKIVVENLYKIFGPSPEHAIELIDEGHDKETIFQKTGNTVGVQETSFAVREGETFVVMGLSGSGKSTLIRMLNRLIEPTRGRVVIDDNELTGVSVEDLRDIRLRKMSMVFQHFALFPHMSVCENVEFGLRAQGVEPEERRHRALDSLRQVGLEAWADSPPRSLSGGMQQRVGLARGLAVDPEILLMDEPFSALDPLIRRDMQIELLELQRRVHKTIVFITHDLNEALILGDRIAIMKAGQFDQVDTPQEIVANPATDYVRAFTQDIDRSRVYMAEYVMEDPKALELEKDTTETALQRMHETGRMGLHVLDREGRIAGLVMYSDVAERAGAEEALGSVLCERYPTTEPKTHLHRLYTLCSEGQPVAVVNDDGRLLGVLDPLHVFEMLAAETDSEETTASGFQEGAMETNEDQAREVGS
jgi:glycine betaine/proline transport system ATP-binding protein